MFGLKARRERRILERDQRFTPLWNDVMAERPLFGLLSQEERRRLRELAILFLHRVDIEPAGGMVLDDRRNLTIAALACVPVLNLGLDWYRGWYSIVVYPDTFVSDHEAMDEDGVVHHIVEAREGESWERGPVLLAWEEVAASGRLHGYDVVIHEAAHRLDHGNGALDGLPPLHPDMPLTAWTEAFTAVYEELCEQVDRGEEPPIDPYAAESPAEFFAVLSEHFFELAPLLAEGYPALYAQLRAFYRWDPAARQATSGHLPE